MEDSREQLMARLNDVTVFAEQESKRADCLLREKEEIVKQYESDVSMKDQMIAIEGGHRQDAILELAQVKEAKQEERCTMDEKSKEAEYWRLTAKGVYDEYLEEMHELQGQLKEREAKLKQEESFVRQLDADNEELRAHKKLETQEASSGKDGHRERAVVKRAEGGPQANSTRVDKKMAGLVPSSSSNLTPNSSLMPGSILFPSFGDPMIDVHLSQMQGVVGHVPQSTTATGGSDGGGNNGTTPPLDYSGFSPNGNRQGASLRSTSGGHLNIQGPNTRFPLSGSSKRQGCVSHSTPEAEIVAADVAMRSMGMPAPKLLERVLKKSPNFVFYDDNKARIGVVRLGRNPTMRHLERSHGVSISWMHEMFTRDYMYLAYEVTDRMAADIYTKAFSEHDLLATTFTDLPRRHVQIITMSWRHLNHQLQSKC